MRVIRIECFGDNYTVAVTDAIPQARAIVDLVGCFVTVGSTGDLALDEGMARIAIAKCRERDYGLSDSYPNVVMLRVA